MRSPTAGGQGPPRPRRGDASAAGEQSQWTTRDERDLVLAGFLTFSDPPLPDATEAVASLRDATASTSRSSPATTRPWPRHVCGAVGLDVGDVVLGADLERMTDAALAQVAERATVFARVSPAQKNRILLALKRRGHVVGFIGDGINDAPSLHAADVGISVPGAVDVARDAADIILLRSAGLDVLHGGILEGRRAFGNVMKYLLMGTSSNFGNMFSMAARRRCSCRSCRCCRRRSCSTTCSTTSSQITIPTDNVDASCLRKPAALGHRRSIRRFMLFIGPISSVFDFLTFFVLLRVFHAGQALFHTGWFVESLARRRSCSSSSAPTSDPGAAARAARWRPP